MLQTALAVALGNRSACLFSLGYYEHTIEDINFALSLGYPEETRYKLYERLGRCQVKLGRPAKAKPALMIATQLVKKSGLDQSKQSQLLKGIAKLQSSLKAATIVGGGETQTCESQGQASPEGLSSKVVVDQNDRVGRFIRADGGDLEANETVLVEKPFAAVLNADKGGHNCHNCFRRLVAAVPCMTCSGVAFW